MWFEKRFSIGVKCSECGKKLNAVEGLTYRDYDFVLEVEPHVCEPANKGLHTDGRVRGAFCEHGYNGHCPVCDALNTPPAGKA